LFRPGKPARSVKRQERRRCYEPEVAAALKAVLDVTDRLCSKRLHPFLPELVNVLGRHIEIAMTADMEAQLYRMLPWCPQPSSP